MFDGNFRSSVDRYTAPVGRTLVQLRVTADVLTTLGIAMAIACAAAIATGHHWLALGLLIASGLPDLLDGPVAKASGMQSIRGAFFDSVSDRISDALVLGGIAWYLADFYGGQIALLPFAVLAASQLISYMRAKAEIFGFSAKGGIMERAERIIAICIGLAFIESIVPILWIILGLTVITGIQRFAKVWRQATNENPVLAARRRETRPWMRGFFAQWADTDERRRRGWTEWATQRRQSRRRSVDTNR